MEREKGVMVMGLNHLMEVGVAHFGEAEVAQAAHTYELPSDTARSRVHLYIDYQQLGVGGDDSWEGGSMNVPE